MAIAEVVKFNGACMRETDKAIQFAIIQDDGEDGPIVWFPFSQVESIMRADDAIEDTLDSIVVSMWIARAKELI